MKKPKQAAGKSLVQGSEPSVGSKRVLTANPGGSKRSMSKQAVPSAMGSKCRPG